MAPFIFSSVHLGGFSAKRCKSKTLASTAGNLNPCQISEKYFLSIPMT